MSEQLGHTLRAPLRYPDTSSGDFMAKRGRWLVLLGFLLPGSAQILSGNRKLGRFGVGATLTLIALAAIALAGFLFARVPTLTILTNSIVLLVVQWLIVAYAVLWVILGIDTLRLTRLVKITSGWRVPIAAFSVLLTALPVAGALWLSGTVGAGRSAIAGIFEQAAPAVQPVDGRYNFLLLGADAGEDREGLRPDSISLVSVDAESGQSVIIGLPRELTGMPFPEDSPLHNLHPSGFGYDWGCDIGVCFLNGLYNEVNVFNPDLYSGVARAGEDHGIRAMKDAVTGATGLEVQFYVLIDMAGFEQLIDALGGVVINVEQRLPVGGNAEGEGIESWIEVGEQRMNGYTAQWYARSRYTTDDYDRMRRQRELQRAILAQMTPLNVIQRFQDLASAGTSIVMTDIPESMIGRFVDLAAQAKNYEPISVELTPPTVNPEYPDYDLIHVLVRDGVARATHDPDAEEADLSDG